MTSKKSDKRKTNESPSKMKRTGPSSKETIVLESHRDLRRNARAICERINADPDLARLVLVNAIFAFEDAGVEMSDEVKKHIRHTLSRPKRLDERKERLGKELDSELGKLGAQKIPRDPKSRAELVFGCIGLEPATERHRESLSLREMERSYGDHPLVEKLARYDRACRGGFILHTKGSYNKFKSGRKRHRWVKSFRFKI